MKIVCPHCKYSFEQNPNDIFCPSCHEIADPQIHLQKSLQQMFPGGHSESGSSSKGGPNPDHRIFSWKKK